MKGQKTLYRIKEIQRHGLDNVKIRFRKMKIKGGRKERVSPGVTMFYWLGRDELE